MARGHATTFFCLYLYTGGEPGFGLTVDTLLLVIDVQLFNNPIYVPWH